MWLYFYYIEIVLFRFVTLSQVVTYNKIKQKLGMEIKPLIKTRNFDKFPKWLKRKYLDSLNNAIEFILKNYDVNLSDFKKIEIYYSKTGRFAKFVHCGTIRIVDRNKWGTYKKKSIGMYANWIKVDLETSYTTQLIHELTHYVQQLEKRQFSEVETTKNEIEWVKENRPHYYEQLEEI